MAWLRIDDGFTGHPKVAALSDGEFRAWVRLLCWSAAYKTDEVPRGIVGSIVGITKKRLERYAELGLLDEDDSGYTVHDWYSYNPKDPTAADRMRRLRERAPQPRGGQWERTRSELFERDKGICIDCGQFDEGWNADHEPHREDLISQGISIYDAAYIVTRCHSCHARKTRHEAIRRANTGEHDGEPEANTDPNGSVPRAQERAPGPSPTQSQEQVTATGSSLSDHWAGTGLDPDEADRKGREYLESIGALVPRADELHDQTAGATPDDDLPF